MKNENFRNVNSEALNWKLYNNFLFHFWLKTRPFFYRLYSRKEWKEWEGNLNIYSFLLLSANCGKTIYHQDDDGDDDCYNKAKRNPYKQPPPPTTIIPQSAIKWFTFSASFPLFFSAVSYSNHIKLLIKSGDFFVVIFF